MTEIVVLCPTRGRPERARAMAETFRATALRIASELVLVVDDDDPYLDAYQAIPASVRAVALGPIPAPDLVRVMVLPRADSRNLTTATNLAAARAWDEDVVIGHVGDDHAFRTPGWDRRVLDVLREPGVAYGDDLLQGPVLPTAVFMSAIIPRTLGWYALPGTRHMKIDTAWKTLGEGLARLHYLPDVVIEHLHPAAGKADDDEGYATARAGRERDKRVYKRWVEKGGLARDLDRLRRAIA